MNTCLQGYITAWLPNTSASEKPLQKVGMHSQIFFAQTKIHHYRIYLSFNILHIAHINKTKSSFLAIKKLLFALWNAVFCMPKKLLFTNRINTSFFWCGIFSCSEELFQSLPALHTEYCKSCILTCLSQSEEDKPKDAFYCDACGQRCLCKRNNVKRYAHGKNYYACAERQPGEESLYLSFHAL